MTKLVVVLAAVVVVILIIVVVAARNMRAEDPEEFAERRDNRGNGRGGPERDQGYDSRDTPRRYPARAGGNSRGAPPPRPRSGTGPNGRGRPPGAGLNRDFGDRDGFDDTGGFDGRGQSWSEEHDEPAAAGRGYPQDDSRGRAGAGSGRPPSRAGAPIRNSSAGGSGPAGPSTVPRNGAGPARNGSPATRRPEPQADPARPRPARSKRSSDSSEWDSSEWEKLSDVDYWKELSSEKPLTTTAQPAASRPGRRGVEPEAETQAMAPRAPSSGPRRDGDSGRTTRGSRQPARGDMPGRPDMPARGDTAMPSGRTDLAPAGRPRTGSHELPRLNPGPASDQSMPRAPSARGRSSAPGRPSAPGRSSVPGRPSSPGRSSAPGRPTGPGPSSLPSPPSLPGPSGLPGPSSLPSSPGRHGSPSLPPGPPSLPPPGPSSLPQTGRTGRRARADRDNDPLTSPSFPAVPADSRSYHNGRSGQPANGATAPQAYPPATDPYGYAAAASYPAPANPAPMRPASAGNPYGSYVTPDAPATPPSPSYNQYPPAQGNGNGYLPAPPVPADRGLPGNAGNGYWQQSPAVPGLGQVAPGYQAAPGQLADPAAATAAYGNGYGEVGQAGYAPNGYPAGSADPAAYPPPDPYGRDGRGQYPEYGPRG